MEKVSVLMKDIYSEIFSYYLPQIFGEFSNYICTGPELNTGTQQGRKDSEVLFQATFVIHQWLS
jgi:hypothetical protein